jgi:Mg2+ and Co2+ transporter CorA
MKKLKTIVDEIINERLLSEEDIETAAAEVEDEIDDLAKDLKSVDLESDDLQTEALGALTLAGVALSLGMIVKLVGKFINLLGKIPGLKFLSGERLVAIGEKYHHIIVGAIEKAIMKAGVKDKKKAHKVAELIHTLIVAALLLQGGSSALQYLAKGKLKMVGIKTALNAVKSGEIAEYIQKVIQTVEDAGADLV